MSQVPEKLAITLLLLLLLCLPAVGQDRPTFSDLVRSLDPLLEPDAVVRAEAASSLGFMANEAAVEPLARSLDPLRETSESVRRRAVYALENLGNEAAVKVLIKSLDPQREPSKLVRWSVGNTLGRLGNEAAVEPLIKSLDPQRELSESVRVSAAIALGNLGNKAAVEPLIRSLNTHYEPDPKVRSVAANALGHLGDKASGAYEALAGVAETDPSPTVRRDASAALFAIPRPSRIGVFFTRYPKTTVGIGGYLLLSLLVASVHWRRPLWLYRVNEYLGDLAIPLPGDFKSLKLPLRHALIVGFFHRTNRVLDAWVSEHLAVAKAVFADRKTVQARATYVRSPVRVSGKVLAEFSPSQLEQPFSRRNCILISGDGGTGKTTLACQLAIAAMGDTEENRLAGHRMLPVLIEHDLPAPAEDPHGPLLEAAHGQLEVLVGRSDIPRELVVKLLKRRRVLVLVDAFSEMGVAARSAIQPNAAGFPATALIVTSRSEDHLGPDINRIDLEPLRVDADRFVSFIDSYLSLKGVRSDFDDTQFLEACTQLSRLLAQRPATILLTKLFADQMIAQWNSDTPDLPRTTPDLMLAYVNNLNRRRPPEAPDDPELHLVLRRIGWECLRETLRPSAARSEALEEKLKDLEDLGDFDALERYLVEDLRLLQRVEPRKDRVRFGLDPLAEYFAAMELCVQYGEEEEKWRIFLEKADQVEGSPRSIRGFLVAVLDCIEAGLGSGVVPATIVQELQRRSGLDPEVIEKARRAQRVQTLVGRLDSNEDRFQALRELREIGEVAAAAPALAKLASTDDQEFQREIFSAFCLIGAAAVPYLATLTNVTTLDLSGTPTTDVSALVGLPNLTNLYIAKTGVKDISGLTGLSNLTILDLSDTRVTDISGLAGLSNLTTLDLSDNHVLDVSALAGLLNLTTLNLSATRVKDVSGLAGLRELTTLNLTGTVVEDVSALAGLPNLTTLNLSATRVEDIQVLADIPELTALYLGATKVVDVSALASLRRLTILQLAATEVEDVSGLASLPNLTTLDLSGTSVKDVSALASLPKLTTLDLYGTGVEDLSPLSGLPELTLITREADRSLRSHS